MNKSYVTTGKPKAAGAVYRAAIGSTLPTTAAATLDQAFIELGHISEDGLTNNNSPSAETIKDWAGQVVLTVSTEKPDTFALTFIEALNPEVAKGIYGASNVTVDGQTGYSITVNANSVEHYSYVIDIALTSGGMKRIVIPEGSITEVGEIAYKANEAVGYNVTMEALPDASGNNHYEYIVYSA